jgi:hypothetical protein
MCDGYYNEFKVVAIIGILNVIRLSAIILSGVASSEDFREFKDQLEELLEQIGDLPISLSKLCG